MTENEIGSPRMDSFQRIPAPNPPLVSWFPPHRRAGFPRPAPLPSARGKFMANCFNRWYGTTWCTKYTRPCESGRSRVADFAKGEIVSSFRSRKKGVDERRKEGSLFLYCYIIRLTVQIFCLLTRKMAICPAYCDRISAILSRMKCTIQDCAIKR